MTFPYNKKLPRREGLLGLLFGVFGIFYVWSEPRNFLKYYMIIFGLFWAASAIYKWKRPYFQIKEGELVRSDFKVKKIKLSEVIRIKKFAGEFTLFTNKDKLKIHSELLNKDDRKKFEEFLDSLAPMVEETTKKVADFKHF